MNRQRGAGTRILLDYLCEVNGVSVREINGYSREVNTHMAVAQAVLSGTAHAGMGVASAASLMGLDFIPLGEEEYDFIFRQDVIDSAKGRLVLEILKSQRFRSEVERLGGYLLENPGDIIRDLS